MEIAFTQLNLIVILADVIPLRFQQAQHVGSGFVNGGNGAAGISG